MSKNSKSTANLELVAARFVYAAAAVSTLGDLLEMIAAGITVQILEQKANQAGAAALGTAIQEEDVLQMNQQIDYLINELGEIRQFIQL